MGNCDHYSDSPEPLVVKQPKSTRVKEPTLLCNHLKKPDILKHKSWYAAALMRERFSCQP